MARPRSVVLVGASLAGHATARALRQQGFDGRITLVGDEPHRPYDRPPLSKEFLAGSADRSALTLETEGEDLDAEWLLGQAAVGLDVAQRCVELSDGQRISGDAVVIATGSKARRIPGALPGVHTVRTLDDAETLRADLVPGAAVAIIGAGFIGAEIASTLKGLGHQVTMIEAASTPLAGPLGVELGQAVAGLHLANGVTVLCGVPVAGLTGTDRVTGVRLADDTVVMADVVVAGIGADPAIDWLRGSGLRIDGGVACSAAGLAAPGVWSVGDCSAWFDAQRGHEQRIEHWTDARERPVAMVRAMLGADPGSVRAPYFWSDQYGVRIQFAGRRVGDESIKIEAGSVANGDLLAVYRRDDAVVAVLAMNQPRLFMKYRRGLPATVIGAGPP